MMTKIHILILNEQMLEIIQGLVLLRSNVQGQFTALGSVRCSCSNVLSLTLHWEADVSWG